MPAKRKSTTVADSPSTRKSARVSTPVRAEPAERDSRSRSSSATKESPKSDTSDLMSPPPSTGRRGRGADKTPKQTVASPRVTRGVVKAVESPKPKATKKETPKAKKETTPKSKKAAPKAKSTPKRGRKSKPEQEAESEEAEEPDETEDAEVDELAGGDTVDTQSTEDVSSQDSKEEVKSTAKRGRGRKSAAASEDVKTTPPKGRGRGRKSGAGSPGKKAVQGSPILKEHAYVLDDDTSEVSQESGSTDVVADDGVVTTDASTSSQEKTQDASPKRPRRSRVEKKVTPPAPSTRPKRSRSAKVEEKEEEKDEEVKSQEEEKMDEGSEDKTELVEDKVQEKDISQDLEKDAEGKDEEKEGLWDVAVEEKEEPKVEEKKEEEKVVDAEKDKSEEKVDAETEKKQDVPEKSPVKEAVAQESDDDLMEIGDKSGDVEAAKEAITSEDSKTDEKIEDKVDDIEDKIKDEEDDDDDIIPPTQESEKPTEKPEEQNISQETDAVIAIDEPEVEKEQVPVEVLESVVTEPVVSEPEKEPVVESELDKPTEVEAITLDEPEPVQEPEVVTIDDAEPSVAQDTTKEVVTIDDVDKVPEVVTINEAPVEKCQQPTEVIALDSPDPVIIDESSNSSGGVEIMDDVVKSTTENEAEMMDTDDVITIEPSVECVGDRGCAVTEVDSTTCDPQHTKVNDIACAPAQPECAESTEPDSSVEADKPAEQTTKRKAEEIEDNECGEENECVAKKMKIDTPVDNGATEISSDVIDSYVMVSLSDVPDANSQEITKITPDTSEATPTQKQVDPVVIAEPENVKEAADSVSESDAIKKPENAVEADIPVVIASPEKMITENSEKITENHTNSFPANPLFNRKNIDNPSIDMNCIDHKRKFSVVSYNILADHHLVLPIDATADQTQAYNRSYRHERLMEELRFLDSDIVCLQEVDCKYFEDYLRASMLGLGYDGTFKKKLGEDEDEPDGCATFYKTGRFKCIVTEGISLSESAEKEIDACDQTQDDKDAMLEFLQQPDIMLLNKFECLTSGEVVTVGNIHVGWLKMECPNVQALQIACAFRELLSRCNDGQDSHMLVGDFNQTPAHPGYVLAADGRLNNDMISHLQTFPNVTKSDDTMDSLVNMLWKSFTHNSHGLKSAYLTIQEEEPQYTTTPKDKTVDYIFYSSPSLHALRVLSTADLSNESGLNHNTPTLDYHTDHLSLKASFLFK